MTKRGILSIGIKLIGILAIFSAIRSIQIAASLGLASVSEGAGSIWYLIWGLFALVLYVLLSIILLTKSDTIAAALVTEDESISVQSDEWKKYACSVAFAAVGLLIAANAVPNLLHKIGRIILRLVFLGKAPLDMRELLPGVTWSQLLIPVLEFVLGVIIMRKSSGIVRIINKSWKIPLHHRYEDYEDKVIDDEYNGGEETR